MLCHYGFCVHQCCHRPGFDQRGSYIYAETSVNVRDFEESITASTEATGVCVCVTVMVVIAPADGGRVCFSA